MNNRAVTCPRTCPPFRPRVDLLEPRAPTSRPAPARFEVIALSEQLLVFTGDYTTSAPRDSGFPRWAWLSKAERNISSSFSATGRSTRSGNDP